MSDLSFGEFARRYFPTDEGSFRLAPWQVQMANRLLEFDEPPVVLPPRRHRPADDLVMRSWFAARAGADPAMQAIVAGWSEVMDRFAALDPAIHLTLRDPELHTEDQEDWDDEPEFCWRCDAVDASTDVGLCDDCLGDLNA